MIDYYGTIMGDDLTCFLPIFNDMWKKEIASHNLPYEHSFQITTGNRLRPLLMAWGYYANCLDVDNKTIADYALPIELIHKASILLDDLIDNDKARHELKTFHVQFSNSEALLYALFMLNRGISLMYEKDISQNNTHSHTLLKVIDSMARGGLKEVSSKDGIFNISEVKEIIDLETTSLIENSFVLGYQLSSKRISDIPKEILDIGHSCGYCFQILNDMEPFLAPDINQKYKGAINYDITKSRKNIVIALLYGACTQQERDRLLGSLNFDYIYRLIQNYEIIQLLIHEVESNIVNIRRSVGKLQHYNEYFYSDFQKFLTNMFNICFQKCNISFKEEWFDDRC